jgi:hypothetical protein
MALSRSPIELAKKARVLVGLQNAMSLLFLERTSDPIKARAHSRHWKTHEKAGYMPVSHVLFNKRFEKETLSIGSLFLSQSEETYPHRRE